MNNVGGEFSPPTMGPGEDHNGDEIKGIANELEAVIIIEKGYLWNLVNLAFLLLDVSKKSDGNLDGSFDVFVGQLYSGFNCVNVKKEYDDFKYDLWKYFSAVCLWTDGLLDDSNDKIFEKEKFNLLMKNAQVKDFHNSFVNQERHDLTTLGCECVFFRNYEYSFTQNYLFDLVFPVLNLSPEGGSFLNNIVSFRFSKIEDFKCSITGFTIRPCAVDQAVFILKVIINCLFCRNILPLPTDKTRDFTEGNKITFHKVKTREVSDWLNSMCAVMSDNFTLDVGGNINVVRKDELDLSFTNDVFCKSSQLGRPRIGNIVSFERSAEEMHVKYMGKGSSLVEELSPGTASNYTAILRRLDLLLLNIH